MSEIGPDTRWFTCLQDSRDHAVTDEEFVLCNEPPAGYVRAICGHRVRLAPAVTPPRPTCPKCVPLLAAWRRAAAPTNPARDRWYRLLRRLLNSPAPAKDHDPGASARHSWPVAGGGKGHDGLLTLGGHARPPRASPARPAPSPEQPVKSAAPASPAREARTQ
jgi:hypothetical protein